MPNPRKTIESLQALLRSQRVECVWDGKAFQNTKYVYINKGVIEAFNVGLVTLTEECEFLMALQAAETAKLDQITIQAQQIHRLEEQNGQLNRELLATQKELNQLQEKPEKEMHPTLHALKTLRSLHGGLKPISGDEYKKIIADVDSIIEGGM